VDRDPDHPVLHRDCDSCGQLRPVDGGEAMIENILLTIVSALVLLYLFVALLRPEVF
jgi:K+-transporting ATPase KdpF subunit